MKRYVVCLDRDAAFDRRVGQLLDRPQSAFVEGCEFLAREANGLRSDVVLKFPAIGALSAVLTDQEAHALRGDPSVTSIRESREVRGSPLMPPPPEWENALLANVLLEPWHIGVVNADKCWPITTGKGVKVAVIDSEIDKDLGDLPIVDGHSFHPDAPDWFGAEDFHGTFCASIIGYRPTPAMTGIAPDCDLYALRVNKGGSGRTEYIVAAMQWAAQNKMDVVSLSQWDPDGTDDPHEPPWEDVARAADELTQAGCIVIGISGNSGGVPDHWVTNPGRCPAIVAVGGTERDFTWWGHSSFGPDDLPEFEAVEIVAPSNRIVSVMPHGAISMGAGTSFAAPQVAGACALLKQLRPELTPAELRAMLKSASRDLGPAGRDEKYGAGLLDCFAAISALTGA